MIHTSITIKEPEKKNNFGIETFKIFKTETEIKLLFTNSEEPVKYDICFNQSVISITGYT